MIEIIGVEQNEEQSREWRSLPKNVRQIGECREGRKIYIEDYVVTYLSKIASPNQVYARGAILFGNLYETEEGKAVFISGAVEAENLELDLDETIFDEIIWGELIEKGKKYFPGQKVVGWFLSRIGFSVEVNQKIIDTHKRNFPGDYKVLYMSDSLEKEDAMYLFENQQMKKQRGYYIYYEKNSPMREYMLAGEEGIGKTANEKERGTELRRDRKIVNSYRRMNNYRKDNKKQNMRIKAIRAACGVLIFVMGFFIAGKLGDRFVKMGFEEHAIATFQAMKNVFIPNVSHVEEEIQSGDAGEGIKSKGSQGEVLKEESLERPGENIETENSVESRTEFNEQTKETVSYPKPLYYTVRKGDTLASISRKMYSTDKYTGKLAEANNLSDADEIYEGQKIIIPSME